MVVKFDDKSPRGGKKSGKWHNKMRKASNESDTSKVVLSPMYLFTLYPSSTKSIDSVTCNVLKTRPAGPSNRRRFGRTWFGVWFIFVKSWHQDNIIIEKEGQGSGQVQPL